MKITNLGSEELALGFVEPNGRVLPGDESINIADKYRSHPSLIGMVDSGLVTIDGVNVGDDANPDPGIYGPGVSPDYGVSSAEFNTFARGFAVVKDDWTAVGTVQASATPFIARASKLAPFELNSVWRFKIRFDGLVTVQVDFTKGYNGAQSIVDQLNADAEFTKWAVADLEDVSGDDYVRITTRSVGANALIEFIDQKYSAIDILGFTTPVETAGTGTVSVVTINTVGPIGQALLGVDHNVQLFTTSGGSTNSAELQIQRVTKGTLESGQYTSDAVIQTDAEGKIEFEVAAAAALTETESHVEVVLPADYQFAQVPAARLAVTI